MRGQPLRPVEVTWEDWVLDGPFASYEDPTRPLEAEIGPGDDDFLLDAARDHPEVNWLGIEYSRKRVRRLVRRLQLRGPLPGNLRVVWRPAADLVRPFLVPARVARWHVYFPDPWPKKHHHRYRLLGPEMLADLRDSLVPGGEIHVVTDHADYAEEVVAAAASVEGLENPRPPPGWWAPPVGGRLTVFEERWRGLGRRIHRIDLHRVPGPAVPYPPSPDR